MKRIVACSATLLIVLSTTAVAVTIDPIDSNILYTGRWDFSNPSAPWCGWQGSSIIARFNGTGITATFDSGDTTEYFRIIIDDDPANSDKIPVFNTIQTYTLASGLADSTHKVEIVKESYSDLGNKAVFYGFEVTGAGLVSPPARPPRKIEFYGDSNLAGQSLEHEQNQSATSLRGSYYGYAGITSRMFNAEYQNISKSGATISSQNSVYDRIGYNYSTPKWDFNDFPADVVVVNLGANDVGSSKSKIKNDYHAFLDDLRIAHPSAHIMLFNAWGWDYNEPANYIHEVIAERGDPNMSSKIFPWLFEQWHGCEYDHAGMAQVLADHLSSVMGWSQNPIDVMDGFGHNGNVANGSFEDIAPFGGYGWRYMTNGANRIYNPAGAYDGDYYLSINSGSVHQPNPANPGDELTLKLWMRGANTGDQAKITIDFRDQKMWTAPLQTTTETKTLTTNWQQYSMTATAPTGGLHPVFHTRVTLEAVSGDLVYFDDVVLTNYSFYFDKLLNMAGHWLSSDSDADIAPPPAGDGVVDYIDFSALSESWLGD